jgi:hypothetical protein
MTYKRSNERGYVYLAGPTALPTHPHGVVLSKAQGYRGYAYYSSYHCLIPRTLSSFSSCCGLACPVFQYSTVARGVIRRITSGNEDVGSTRRSDVSSDNARLPWERFANVISVKSLHSHMRPNSLQFHQFVHI